MNNKLNGLEQSKIENSFALTLEEVNKKKRVNSRKMYSA